MTKKTVTRILIFGVVVATLSFLIWKTIEQQKQLANLTYQVDVLQTQYEQKEILEKDYRDSLTIREQLQGISIDADTFRNPPEDEEKSYDFGLCKIAEIVETKENYYFKLEEWYDKVFVLPKDEYYIYNNVVNESIFEEAENLYIGADVFVKAFITEKYREEHIWGVIYLTIY